MSNADLLLTIARQSTLEYADIEVGNLHRQHLLQYSHAAHKRADGPRRFLVASLTKPIVAMAAVKLAARGECTLSSRVSDYLADFGKAPFRRITIRHLLTHTSGLPDALSNNAELRKAHAPLERFLQEAISADQPLTFTPGTSCSYSSIGFLVLATVIETITGTSLPDHLQSEFFAPLQMNDTRLGLTNRDADQFLPTVLPSLAPNWQDDADDWGWNSRYWRCLGAPWGGLMSTAADLGRFAQMMLNDGRSIDGDEVLPKRVVDVSTADQISEYAASPTFAGPDRSWGFGWRRQWATHPASFGDFVSSECYGHWGATGTLMWIDPIFKRYGVFLTTTPYEDSCSIIQRFSNAALMESETNE